MKFIVKKPEELVAFTGLRYENQTERRQAREALVDLQHGFCAYSERYLKPLDSVEVEHFDPRKKGTASDSISNWHAVLRWMNAHKARKIDPFLPLPELSDLASGRIRYDRGEFVCADDDIEARNLIEFLGVNRPEVFDERSKHVQRIKRVRELCERCGDDFHALLRESPEDLSFASALEGDLGVPAFQLILESVRTEG